MFGVDQGLTPQQQSEAQANFRFGLQLGAEHTARALAAQNALAQTKATNEAELQRQQVLRQMINEQRSSDVLEQAKTTRAATAASFTESQVRSGISGLRGLASAAERQYAKWYEHPDKYDDASLEEASSYTTGLYRIVAKGEAALAATPQGQAPNVDQFTTEMANLPAPTPKLRQSYLDSVKAKTDKDNRWIPSTGKGKKDPDWNKIDAGQLDAISSVDAAWNNYKQFADADTRTPEMKAQAQVAGLKSDADVALLNYQRTYNHALIGSSIALSNYRSKDPRIKKMIDDGIANPFDPSPQGQAKTGAYFSKILQNAPEAADSDELNDLSFKTTGKPATFWQIAPPQEGAEQTGGFHW